LRAKFIAENLLSDGTAIAKGRQPFVGPAISFDLFYAEDPDEWKLWAKFGCLAIEM
jgi:purine-nucleoside phosphorylase